MLPIFKKLVIGVEDLLGVVMLGMAAVGLATTIWTPPEGGPSAAFGYLISFGTFAVAVLFLMAAMHLHKTQSFSIKLHVAPLAVLSVMVVAARSVPHL
ncbi:hypothetical protein [Pseudoxanthomonas japonensis]|uniref:hypothetical protein n=1 Tax=Pseudoxanthomonas japonensis TaxID=69284 RepID=UPI003748FFD4